MQKMSIHPKDGFHYCVVCLSICLLCTSCQKTPEQSYVVNKEGQDSLIMDNQSEDTGELIRDQIQAPARVDGVQMDLNNESYATFEADVILPEVTAVPIYTVRDMELSSEQIRQMAECLFDGEAYKKDPNVNLSTPMSIQKELEYKKLVLYAIFESDIQSSGDGLTDGPRKTDEPDTYWLDGRELTREEYLQAIQAEIDSLELQLYQMEQEEPEYKSRPADYTYDVCTAQVFKDFADSGDSGPGKIYMDYEYMASETVGTRNDNTYILQVAKDDEMSSIYYYLADAKTPIYDEYMPTELHLYSTTANYSLSSNLAAKDNLCDYTLEEAKELCMDTIKRLHITDMEIQAVCNVRAAFDGVNYANQEWDAIGYDFYLYRTYQGISDEYYDKGEPFSQGYEDSDLGKLDQASGGSGSGLAGTLEYNAATDMLEHTVERELLRVRITNYGVTELIYLNPKVTEELQAEHVMLMDFGQMLENSKADMQSLFAGQDVEFDYHRNREKLRLKRIEFHYSMMQSPYSEGEYSMVPVWDFKNGAYGGTILTVNAIDGSMMDRDILH